MRTTANTKHARPSTRQQMPDGYPVVTVEQALADGTAPWSLRAVANRLQKEYPSHARRLRRVAAQMTAGNDNHAVRRAA